MSANTRFSVAVHVMTALAYRGAESATSQQLATSIGTNPVVVRRLLSQLHQAGLVDCHPGKSGGCRLARTPEKITLYDIYSAVESGGPFVIPQKAENRSCQVACNMKQILQGLFDRTQTAIQRTLQEATVADLVQTVRQSSTA